MESIERQQEKPNQDFNYPKELTATDIQLVNKQCELQHAQSQEQVEGFANAYLEAKKLALNFDEINSLTSEKIEAFILQLAEMIEKRNHKGYRQVPVTFAGGGSALSPDLIPRAMESFSNVYAEGSLNPIEAYTEFEKIHPFEDGNGRLGDLLWKIGVTRDTGKWPEDLPPDVFGAHSTDK